MALGHSGSQQHLSTLSPDVAGDPAADYAGSTGRCRGRQIKTGLQQLQDREDGPYPSSQFIDSGPDITRSNTGSDHQELGPGDNPREVSPSRNINQNFSLKGNDRSRSNLRLATASPATPRRCRMPRQRFPPVDALNVFICHSGPEGNQAPPPTTIGVEEDRTSQRRALRQRARRGKTLR